MGEPSTYADPFGLFCCNKCQHHHERRDVRAIGVSTDPAATYFEQHNYLHDLGFHVPGTIKFGKEGVQVGGETIAGGSGELLKGAPEANSGSEDSGNIASGGIDGLSTSGIEALYGYLDEKGGEALTRKALGLYGPFERRRGVDIAVHVAWKECEDVSCYLIFSHWDWKNKNKWVKITDIGSGDAPLAEGFRISEFSQIKQAIPRAVAEAIMRVRNGH